MLLQHVAQNKINQSIKIIPNTQNIFVGNDGIKIYELR